MFILVIHFLIKKTLPYGTLYHLVLVSIINYSKLEQNSGCYNTDWMLLLSTGFSCTTLLFIRFTSHQFPNVKNSQNHCKTPHKSKQIISISLQVQSLTWSQIISESLPSLLISQWFFCIVKMSFCLLEWTYLIINDWNSTVQCCNGPQMMLFYSLVFTLLAFVDIIPCECFLRRYHKFFTVRFAHQWP